MMKKGDKKNNSEEKLMPSRTLDESEMRCVADATRLAEQKLADGTASNQIIMHYLKLGSEKSRLEVEKIKYETELVRAKTEQVKSQQRTEEMFANAMKMLKVYSGEEDGGNI